MSKIVRILFAVVTLLIIASPSFAQVTVAGVYRDLAGPPNRWDREKVDRNLFAVYDSNVTNHTAVDPRSIMMYPIAKSWVTDPDFARDLNTDLSDVDRTFIHEQYP